MNIEHGASKIEQGNIEHLSRRTAMYERRLFGGHEQYQSCRTDDYWDVGMAMKSPSAGETLMSGLYFVSQNFT
jgi:hypothetical protein